MIKKHCHGKILDVGGVKNSKFDYSEYISGNVTFLNLDEKTNPDILGDFLDKKVTNNLTGKFDGVLCNFVLEHVSDPGTMVDHLFSVLKNNGVLILSVPFVYQLHGLPQDYFRYSSSALQYFLKDFEEVSIVPFGNRFLVLMHLLSFSAFSFFTSLLAPFFCFFDFIPNSKWPFGYIVVAKKTMLNKKG